MTAELNLRYCERLIESLSSDDAFVRRDAIESLALLTQQRLDYRWSGGEAERAASVKRWRKWLDKANKQRHGKKLEAKIQILASGELSLSEIDKHLKDLPPQQKQALMAQFFKQFGGKGASGLACELCGKKPPTVKLTSLQPDGTYERLAACERCAAK